MKLRMLTSLVLFLATFFCLAQTVRWRTVAEGTNSKVSKHSVWQVQTEGDWLSIWKQLGQSGRAPKVDFAKEEMVILNLATQDKKSTSVYIETITFDAGQLCVKGVRKLIRNDKPGSSSPWVAVALDRIGGHVQLTMRDILGYPSFTSRPSCACGPRCTGACNCGCHMSFPIDLDYSIEDERVVSPFLAAATYKITSSSELRQYWDLSFSMVDEDQQPDRPRMDFRTEALIAIHLGRRQTGGYGIGIQSLQVINPSETTLKWYEITPEFNQPVTQMITSPYIWVRVPRLTSKITIIKMPGRPLR